MLEACRIHCTIALAVVFAACSHTEPFRPDDQGREGPLVPGSLARFTFNPGQDLVPAWLPDGSAFVYTAERLDRSDRDRCLAFMPGAGGSISRYVCRTTSSDDSLNVLDQAALSGDGRIAYVRAANSRSVSRLGPDAQQLVVASMQRPDSAALVQTIPFTAPWSQTYDAISFIGWLGPTRLVMIGDSVRYPLPCPSCQRDTVRTGIEIMTLDFAATPQLSLVPGTRGATSVTVGPSGDVIFFTLAGDTRIYRFVFSTTQQDTVFDFGAGHIVRDIRFAGGTVAAILDGRPGDGGYIHLLDLATGRDTALAFRANGQELWFERPALSPDGRRVVSQGRSLTITPIFDASGNVIGADTTASRLRDLWLSER